MNEKKTALIGLQEGH